MFRYVRLALEVLAGFIAAVVLLSVLLAWRLDSSPARATFLTPSIEKAIDKMLPGLHSAITHTILTWDNKEHSLALHAEQVDIRDDNGAHIIVIPAVDVEVSLFGFFVGHFLPTALKIDDPQIHLIRSASGQWSAGGTITPPSATSASMVDARATLMSIIDNLSHAHLTRKLEINHIAVTLEDQVRHTTWSASIPEITLERQGRTLKGLARVDVTQGDAMTTLDLHYQHEIASVDHTLSLRMDGFTPSLLARGDPATLGLPQAAMLDVPLTGEASVTVDEHLEVVATTLQLHGAAGSLMVPDFWEHPRSVKSIDAKIDYAKEAPQQMQATVAIDFGGPKFSLITNGVPSQHARQDMDFMMRVKLDDMPLDQINMLWPKPVLTNVRDWFVTSISKGQVTHGEAALKGYLAWNDLDNMTISEASGKLAASGAHVIYLDGMPPVDDVDASADFDLSQMTIQINGGNTGSLKVSPFVAQITDLDQDTQIMTIPIKINGSVVDIMHILDAPRLRYAKALGLTPDDVTGLVNGVATLHFPLLKTLTMAEVDIKAHADLINIASSKLVPNIDITQGNMTLDLDKEGMSVQGPATLNKVPFQVGWHQNFAAAADKPLAQGTVIGSVKEDQWTLFGIDTLSGTRGNTAVNLQILQPAKNRTTIEASLDMTAAEVHLDFLNWKKPMGAPTFLHFNASLQNGKPIMIRDISLRGGPLAAKGSASMMPDTLQFLSVDFPTLVVGRTNASVHYGESADDDHTLLLQASGQSLDIVGMMGGKEPAHTDKRPRRFSVKLAKLYTSDTGFMENVEGYAVRDAQGWSEISMHGRVQGETWLDISLALKDGHRVFLMMCDDFGKALHGMGFTSTVDGGVLKVSGSSTNDKPRVIEGSVKIGSFVVNDLPLLATLLNATSPFGIMDLINKSISFDHLKGKFRWEGDDIELIQNNLPGSSVGLNIEGKVNMNTGAANLHGTIVPFSLVNRFLNYIPLIGDLITGGEGQGVLAVAYTITGNLSDPRIIVNPISLLTPGFIRNLFFGGDDSDDAPAEDVPAQ